MIIISRVTVAAGSMPPFYPVERCVLCLLGSDLKARDDLVRHKIIGMFSEGIFRFTSF